MELENNELCLKVEIGTLKITFAYQSANVHFTESWMH